MTNLLRQRGVSLSCISTFLILVALFFNLEVADKIPKTEAESQQYGHRDSRRIPVEYVRVLANRRPLYQTPHVRAELMSEEIHKGMRADELEHHKRIRWLFVPHVRFIEFFDAVD